MLHVSVKASYLTRVWVIVLLLSFFPAKAVDPVSATVGAALLVFKGKIFSNINKSVNNFFNRFDNSITRARGNADGLLDSAKNDMESFSNKIIDELEGQEKQLWLFYNMALTQLNESVKKTSVTGKLFAFDIGNVVEQINPFGTEKPVIFWVDVEPPMYVHTDSKRTITAHGLNLHNKDNQLLVNGKIATLMKPTPSSLIFSTNDVSIKLGLNLDYSLVQDRWYWFDKIDNRKFIISLENDNVGSVSVIYTTDMFPTIQRIWQPRVGCYPIMCRNSSNAFAGDRCTASCPAEVVNSRAGYRIEPDTIAWSESRTSGSIRDLNSRIYNRSGNSFTVELSITAHQGTRRRVRGWYAVKWNEKKERPDKVEGKTKKQKLLLSSKGFSAKMPANATPNGAPIHIVNGKIRKT